MFLEFSEKIAVVGGGRSWKNIYPATS